MITEENLRIAKSYIEAFNAQNWTQFSELLAEDVIYNNPIYPEPFKGRSAVLEYYKQLFIAYSDFKSETFRLFGQGNNICWEGILTGTHEGPIRDIAPTYKSVRIPICQIVTIEEGKITKLDAYFDQLGYRAQLGLE